MIYELKLFCLLCLLDLVNSGTIHDGDSGVELNIPEGIEGPVKVKVMTLLEHLPYSEDEVNFSLVANAFLPQCIPQL